MAGRQRPVRRWRRPPGHRRQAGRRTGDGGTRAAILAAARDQFARKGYDGASLRMIAADAGVDTGLIRHFFGSKEDLFAATLDIPEALIEPMVQALHGDPDRLGERLIHTYLGLWENPVSAEPFLAVPTERALQVHPHLPPLPGCSAPRQQGTPCP